MATKTIFNSEANNSTKEISEGSCSSHIEFAQARSNVLVLKGQSLLDFTQALWDNLEDVDLKVVQLHRQPKESFRAALNRVKSEMLAELGGATKATRLIRSIKLGKVKETHQYLMLFVQPSGKRDLSCEPAIELAALSEEKLQAVASYLLSRLVCPHLEQSEIFQNLLLAPTLRLSANHPSLILEGFVPRFNFEQLPNSQGLRVYFNVAYNKYQLKFKSMLASALRDLVKAQPIPDLSSLPFSEVGLTQLDARNQDKYGVFFSSRYPECQKSRLWNIIELIDKTKKALEKSILWAEDIEWKTLKGTTLWHSASDLNRPTFELSPILAGASQVQAEQVLQTLQAVVHEEGWPVQIRTARAQSTAPLSLFQMAKASEKKLSDQEGTCSDPNVVQLWLQTQDLAKITEQAIQDDPEEEEDDIEEFDSVQSFTQALAHALMASSEKSQDLEFEVLVDPYTAHKISKALNLSAALPSQGLDVSKEQAQSPVSLKRVLRECAIKQLQSRGQFALEGLELTEVKSPTIFEVYIGSSHKVKIEGERLILNWISKGKFVIDPKGQVLCEFKEGFSLESKSGQIKGDTAQYSELIQGLREKLKSLGAKPCGMPELSAARALYVSDSEALLIGSNPSKSPRLLGALEFDSTQTLARAYDQIKSSNGLERRSMSRSKKTNPLPYYLSAYQGQKHKNVRVDVVLFEFEGATYYHTLAKAEGLNETVKSRLLCQAKSLTDKAVQGPLFKAVVSGLLFDWIVNSSNPQSTIYEKMVRP